MNGETLGPEPGLGPSSGSLKPDSWRPNPRILMCPPTHFGIEYEINPWMKRERSANRELAIEQWNRLRDILIGLGVKIECLTPMPGLPDMVFTANAGVVFRNVFVTSYFRHEERRGESPHFDQWFLDHQFQVMGLARQCGFEGAGDALFCGETLFAGYRYRSEIASHHLLGELLDVPVLSLELVDSRFYHLDTCFCPLRPDLVLWYPGAFDEYGRKVIETRIENRIAVSDVDAGRFACNAVVVGGSVVLNDGCNATRQNLEAWGFEVHPTPLGEFLKSGGSAKCLTLRLDGEEAAFW